MSQRLLLYSDGGARGNPGSAAIAYIAKNENGETLKEDSQFIGIATNNQAEYRALILGLKFAVDSRVSEVVCHLDSELVAKQLRGEYAVKNSDLKKLNVKVCGLLSFFKNVSFVNVRRSNHLISRADTLVNKVLDEEAQRTIRGKPQSRTFGEGSLFVHVSIRTSNMKRSIDFYGKYFDLKVVRKHDLKLTNSEIVFMQDSKCRGCLLELTFYHDQKDFQQPPYEKRLFDHLGFTVTDINATIDEMKRFGVTVADEPKEFSPETIIAFVEDPDGTLIELIQHK
jgi:ribonuclease HI